MMKTLKKLSSDKGFTFIEVFIAVVLIGILSTIILISSNRIVSSMNQGKENLDKRYQLLSLRLLLKKETQNIINPWFLKDYKIEDSKDGIILYYYKGNKDSYLELQSNEVGVTIITDDETLFASDTLKGKFTFEDNCIIYKFEDIMFIFPLGAFHA